MNKPLKIALIIIVSLLILGVLGMVTSDAVVKSKIEDALQNSIPDSIEFKYSELDVNTWDGRVVLRSPKIKNIGKTTELLNTQLDLDSLIVDGFSFWDYLVRDKINIESIEFHQPYLTYYHNPLVDEKAYKYSKLEDLKKDISVGRIQIQNGDITVRNLQTDSLLLQTKKLTANVMAIKLNPQTVQRRIPLLFEDYNVHFDNLFYQMSDFENLTIRSSKITRNESLFNELKLFTKYTKAQLSSKITKERDHFEVSIDSVEVKNQDFGYKQDSIFYFKAGEVVISQPKMNVYRNKLLTDDVTIKPLYNSMLRSLNFDLTLSTVSVVNGAINYSEKVKIDAPAGELDFKNLNASIANLGNTYSSSEKTTIHINTRFMKETPLNIVWYFDVNDVNDHFIFKADLGNLKANRMNMFTEPNLNVRLEGEIHKTYFTIDGNRYSSNVDLKLNYDDFKIIIMQKKEPKKNQLLSALVNIFVSKNSDNKDGNFSSGSAKVERNRTKSIFNFIWLNASAGVKNAMTGSGKDK